MPVVPRKLRSGDGVRVVAPSCSMCSMEWITDEFLRGAEQRFSDLGLRVSYGKHVREMDDFKSSSVVSRVEDLHQAFADPSIQLIHCIRGGWNCNQLLRHLDYDLIRKNPKILCGFSDITALSNAIYTKTGLVGYSGPNYYYFGCRKGFDRILDAFTKCLFSEDAFAIEPSEEWSNDYWGNDQEHRTFMPNEGYWVLREGRAEGPLFGGNLCTLNLLQGTDFMPDIRDSVLFLEDDHESRPHTFDRDLQSLIHQPAFAGVRGLVIGRFEQATGMTRALLTQIIEAKRELRTLPVIANADFGHTQPMITFPIGGTVRMEADGKQTKIQIVTH